MTKNADDKNCETKQNLVEINCGNTPGPSYTSMCLKSVLKGKLRIVEKCCVT